VYTTTSERYVSAAARAARTLEEERAQIPRITEEIIRETFGLSYDA
jgi:hypothetical protein